MFMIGHQSWGTLGYTLLAFIQGLAQFNLMQTLCRRIRDGLGSVRETYHRVCTLRTASECKTENVDDAGTSKLISGTIYRN
jgi:hypothetical protein